MGLYSADASLGEIKNHSAQSSVKLSLLTALIRRLCHGSCRQAGCIDQQVQGYCATSLSASGFP